MPTPARPAPPTVRLSASQLAAAVPMLLGFLPADSLVALSLRGPRARVGLTLRLDLVGEAADADVADVVATRMLHDGADRVVLVVYTEAPGDSGRLPRSRLVETVAAALPVPVHEAVLVRSGRWWSYLCDDPRCCPPEGRPIDTGGGAAALAAEQALQGRAVLPDRDAVVASVAPIGGVAAASMRQALARAGAAYAADGAAFLAVGADLVDELVGRYADPPARLSDDEAAHVIVALHDVRLRDGLIQTAERCAEPIRGLVRDLVRRAQPPLDAPVCTLLAWIAYCDGGGVLAGAALDRALDSDPTYSMALLLSEALAGQVHPRELRRVGRGRPRPRAARRRR